MRSKLSTFHPVLAVVTPAVRPLKDASSVVIYYWLGAAKIPSRYQTPLPIWYMVMEIEVSYMCQRLDNPTESDPFSHHSLDRLHVCTELRIFFLKYCYI